MQTRLKHQEGRNITVLLADKTARSAIPRTHNIRSFLHANNHDLKEAKNIFVVATGLLLPEVANFVKRANNSKRLRALLVRQDTYQLWITQLMDMADLRSLRNLLVHSNNDVVKRVLTAWNYGAQNKLIADAAVFGDNLVVRDCALNRYVIPFTAIADLATIRLEDRTHFAISEEGSGISWSKYDIDINLDSIKSALNPEPYIAEAREHDRLIGAAIARLRQKHGLRQTDIAGLDERHLRKIESGCHRATTRSLQALADAHGLTLNAYLNKLSRYTTKL